MIFTILTLVIAGMFVAPVAFSCRTYRAQADRCERRWAELMTLSGLLAINPHCQFTKYLYYCALDKYCAELGKLRTI